MDLGALDIHQLAYWRLSLQYTKRRLILQLPGLGAQLNASMHVVLVVNCPIRYLFQPTRDNRLSG